MNKSLSTDEVQSLVPECKVLTYPEFMRYDSLKELLAPYNCVIFLYMTTENYGHYCAIWKNQNGVLHFFDPYGVYLDDQLNFIPAQKNRELGQEVKHLSELIIKDKSIRTIFVNHYPFQKRKQGINTCGRHVAVRVLLRHLSEDAYQKLFKNKDADKAVVKITDHLAGPNF